jgi:hypothetical protein
LWGGGARGGGGGPEPQAGYLLISDLILI